MFSLATLISYMFQSEPMSETPKVTPRALSRHPNDNSHDSYYRNIVLFLIRWCIRNILHMKREKYCDFICVHIHCLSPAKYIYWSRRWSHSAFRVCCAVLYSWGSWSTSILLYHFDRGFSQCDLWPLTFNFDWFKLPFWVILRNLPLFFGRKSV